MFSSRADLIVNGCYLVTLLAAPAATYTVMLARQGRFELHKRLQTLLLAICYAAVLVLEIRIRVAGGSGALMQGSVYTGSGLLRTVATAHIAGAVVTYAIWGWLLFVSHRAFRRTLPGTFSKSHKRWGWSVLLGLWFTAVSATAVYWMVFVA
ncbi:hypothetical protein ACXR0O_05555 [Verrucomicrobiota bacterium sgz303538]